MSKTSARRRSQRGSAAFARAENGFTLIELLVVVILLATLSAIAVPVFLSQKTKAEEASAQTTAVTAGHVMQGQQTSDATATGSPTANTVTFTSESGDATVSAATIYRNNPALYSANDPVGDSWCVEATSGTTTYHWAAGDNTVQTGPCA